MGHPRVTNRRYPASVPRIERQSVAVWQGRVATGAGTIAGRSSGSFDLAYSEPTRVGEPNGQTSPEELIAAAHAACFSMSLSSGLAKAGTLAEELKTSATVTFQPGEGITRVALTVEGRVPGIDGVEFEEFAEAAKENCPVSKALAGVPEITLEVQLVA
jgi:osmotically inducible protein OsmC